MQCTYRHSLNSRCSIAGESARHFQQLQQLLMLVPGLADVSTASIKAALQQTETSAVSTEAHLRHLDAVGALIQQLCQAGTALVGVGNYPCHSAATTPCCSITLHFDTLPLAGLPGCAWHL